MYDVLYDLKKRGLASPARYFVQIPSDIPVPESSFANDFFPIKVLGQDRHKFLMLACEQAQFPSLNIQATTFAINGIPKHAPYGSAADNVTFTFRISGDMYEKAFFDAWMMGIVDQKHSQISYATNDRGIAIKKNIILHQLPVFGRDNSIALGQAVTGKNAPSGKSTKIPPSDEMDINPYSVTLYNAYPTSITTMELGAGQQSEYHKLTVTFSYSHWRPKLDSVEEIKVVPTREKVLAKSDKDFDLSTNDGFQYPPTADGAGPSFFASLMEKAAGIMKIVKGLLGQDQGLALDLFSKLNGYLEGATGLRIDEVRVFVEEMDRDIQGLPTGDNFSSSSKSALLFGSASLLALLGKPPTAF